MNTFKKIVIVATLGVIGSLPGFAFAQTLTATADFIPLPNESAFQIRINSYSPKVNLEFYGKFGEKGQAVSNTTQTFSLAPTQALPWVSSKINVPNLKSCTEYNFYVYIKSPDYPQIPEKAFGPYTYKSVGPCIGGTNNGGGIGGTNNGAGGSITTTPVASELGKLKDPLNGKFSNLPDLFKALVDVVMVIAIPIVALLIIYSGFLIVTARGNEEKLKKGKSAFAAAIIGGALVLGAYVIARAIGTTVDQIRE